MVFSKIIKKGPRDTQQLLLKRLQRIHPDEPQARLASILEKVRSLESEMRER